MNEVSDDCMHLHTYIHTVHALQRKAQRTPCCQEAVEECVSYVVCYPVHTLGSYVHI